VTKRGRAARQLALLTCSFLLSVAGVTPALASTSVQQRDQQIALREQRLKDREQDASLNALNTRADNADEAKTFILIPVSILIGVLALGGTLGIVFSIRDQGRVSQLHELAVGGEMSSQRRTEQSFSTFLEESQKTLSLVNDTLGLAKEATDRATHAMTTKMKASLDNIEEKAEDLVIDVAAEGTHSELIDKAEHRLEVRRIASELAAIQGYVTLQEIEPGPFSQFIRGLDQYLSDESREALHTLRHLAQSLDRGELKASAYFWLGELHTAFGEYAKAERAYENALDDVKKDSSEAFELESLVTRTRFNSVATSSKARDPFARLGAVDQFLVQLDDIRDKVRATLDEKHQYVLHEIDEIIADIYLWVAAAPGELPLRPLPPPAVAAALKIHSRGAVDETVDVATAGAGEGGTDGIDNRQVLEAEHLEVKDLYTRWERDLTDDDTRRASAVLQAFSVFPADADQDDVGADVLDLTERVDFAIQFDKAECGFLLGVRDNQARYLRVERGATEAKLTAHREHRETVEVAQMLLVSRLRDFQYAHAASTGDREAARDEVNRAYLNLLGEVQDTRDRGVKFFSHLSRVNFDHRAFIDEAKKFEDAALEPKP
jgi:TolA-binding protein